MPWFSEVRPAFLVSQALGLIPYTFVAGIPVKSRSWKIYACIKLVGYVCESFSLYVPVLLSPDKWTFQSEILTMIAALSTAFTFVAHSLTVSRSFDKIRTLFDLIKEYDRSLKIDFTTNSLVVRTWLIFSLPIICCGYLRFRQLSNQSILVKVNKIHSLLLDIVWHTTMLKFVTLVNSIQRRFKHLHNLITANTPKIMYDRNGCSRPVRLNDACRLHDTLVSAANILSSIYDLFLPFWIMEAAAYTTTRIYRVIDTYEEIASSEMLWHCVTEIPNITALVYFFISCHNTNVAAKKIESVALSPGSWLLRERFRSERDEGFIIGQHFALQHVHFTAGHGSFVIKLPFLGGILGTIVTVLVVLSA